MKKFFYLIVILFFSPTGIIAQTGLSYKINGRIQYDYEFHKREKSNAWNIGNEFRRIHLSVSGKLNKKFKYKIETNFAHSKLMLLDAFIEYDGGKWGQLAIGSKAEPTGIAMMTSSKYIPFAERPMLTALQDFRWGSGLHYANYQLFDRKGGIQIALTNKGKTTEGFVDKNLNRGVNFVARAFVTPVKNKENNQIFHLGFNYASRAYADLKFRPENHMGDKYHYTFNGGKRRFETGFEAAWTYRQFSLQGEYKTRTVKNIFDKNYRVNAYYGFISVFLTGEHRPYKHGAFGRVKPLHAITGGGAGAIELIARYSNMQFSNDLIQLPVNAGLPDKIRNIAFGFNWYLTSHIRFMYNYVYVMDQNPFEGNLLTHLIRFQMDF